MNSVVLQHRVETREGPECPCGRLDHEIVVRHPVAPFGKLVSPQDQGFRVQIHREREVGRVPEARGQALRRDALDSGQRDDLGSGDGRRDRLGRPRSLRQKSLHILARDPSVRPGALDLRQIHAGLPRGTFGRGRGENTHSPALRLSFDRFRLGGLLWFFDLGRLSGLQLPQKCLDLLVARCDDRDRRPDRNLLALFRKDLAQYPLTGGFDLHIHLVREHLEQGLPLLDLLALPHQPRADGALLHTQPEPGHDDRCTHQSIPSTLRTMASTSGIANRSIAGAKGIGMFGTPRRSMGASR